MSSLSKNIQSRPSPAPEDYMAKLESKILALESLKEVELLFKKLKFLGSQYDPFASDISPECQKIMKQIGLNNYLENPYLVTNMLLRLLDKTEERINILKH